MDSVNNRSLFRRKSQAARDKVRQMGRVQEPQGILASFQELMQVAGRDRTQNLMPQMMQQPQPVRFQEGGAVAPTFMERFAGTMALPIGQGVDIAATPTPRAPVEVPDISTMVRNNLGDNEEAQAKFTELETALTDPEASDEQRQEAITSAAGVENNREGLRSVVSQITGREQPASATVDELNRAITGVALGGAIGGPRSVAARISEGLLTGLQAQRETAQGREAFAQQLAVARARGSTRSSTYTPERLFQQAVQEIMKDPSEYDVYSERPGAEGRPPEPFVDPVKVRAVAEQIAAVQATALGAVGPAQEVAQDVATTTYTNPETGQIITWNGSQWVDAQSGEPVQ
jgi:hypothetical protein